MSDPGFGFWGDGAERLALVFQSRAPGEIRLLAVAAVVAAAWWLYRVERNPLSPARRRILRSLRIAALLALLVVLAQPALKVTAPSERPAFAATLLDASRSMDIPDARVRPGETRYQAARRVLESPELRDALRSRTTRALSYTFDETLHREASLPPAPEGRRTNLFRAVRDLDAELRGAPLAAVVLFTDGARTTGGSLDDAAQLLKARGTPLFVVGFGDPAPPPDFEVVRVAAPARVRRNTVVPVQATVRHVGMTRPFRVRLLQGDRVMAEREVVPEPGRDTSGLAFDFIPDLAGGSVCAVDVPPADGERFTRNNRRAFTLDFDDTRLPVLYVEGSPRMEYRFLRRALLRDPDFRMVGMLRLAPDRFYLQDADAAHAIPPAGETEQALLRRGFPDSEEALFRFQAVVLGDIEAGFLDERRQRLLERFVKERGGGLLMLGGVHAFGRGGYAGTPVGDLLPVAISANDPEYDPAEFLPRFQARGLEHPAMRLLDDPVANETLWKSMPPLIGLAPAGQPKPGATLLVDRPADGRPVLAAQNAGAGRVAAFLSGGSWYWRVSRPASDGFHEKFWKQLLRWLAAGAREQATVETERDSYARREPVVLRATLLGADLKPLDALAAAAVVTDPLGNAETVPLDWALASDGVYQGTYTPAAEGDYAVELAVKDWKGPSARTRFLVAEPTEEYNDVALKEGALKAMAEETGGAYFDERDWDGLPRALASALTRRRFDGGRVAYRPLWNWPAGFALVLALIGAEWWLRRRWELV